MRKITNQINLFFFPLFLIYFFIQLICKDDDKKVMTFSSISIEKNFYKNRKEALFFLLWSLLFDDFMYFSKTVMR